MTEVPIRDFVHYPVSVELAGRSGNINEHEKHQ